MQTYELKSNHYLGHVKLINFLTLYMRTKISSMFI